MPTIKLLWMYHTLIRKKLEIFIKIVFFISNGYFNLLRWLVDILS